MEQFKLYCCQALVWALLVGGMGLCLWMLWASLAEYLDERRTQQAFDERNRDEDDLWRAIFRPRTQGPTLPALVISWFVFLGGLIWLVFAAGRVYQSTPCVSFLS